MYQALSIKLLPLIICFCFQFTNPTSVCVIWYSHKPETSGRCSQGWYLLQLRSWQYRVIWRTCTSHGKQMFVCYLLIITIQYIYSWIQANVARHYTEDLFHAHVLMITHAIWISNKMIMFWNWFLSTFHCS